MAQTPDQGDERGIVIAPSARATIDELARESADGRETGGILLGRGPDNDGIVRVEIAGDPGPRADRRPDYFLRDLGHARALADEAWAQSRAVWVGEWHTHPMGGPQPSSTDLGTYARLLSASALEFELFVSVIVVPDDDQGWDSPHIWPWLLEFRLIDGQAGESPARQEPGARG